MLINRGKTDEGIAWMEKAVLRELDPERKKRIYIQTTEYLIRTGSLEHARRLLNQALDDQLENPLLEAIDNYLDKTEITENQKVGDYSAGIHHLKKAFDFIHQRLQIYHMF